jgi:hypothetical protein
VKRLKSVIMLFYQSNVWNRKRQRKNSDYRNNSDRTVQDSGPFKVGDNAKSGANAVLACEFPPKHYGSWCLEREPKLSI